MENKKSMNSRPKIRTKAEEEKIQPRHIRAFAHFFKNYMSLSSVVTAALPIPITALGVLPTFQAHTKILSTYTPVFCFLILAYVFYRRHSLACFMFPGYVRDSVPKDKRERVYVSKWTITRTRRLPAFFIGMTLACILIYHSFLAYVVGSLSEVYKPGETDDILASFALHQIPALYTAILLVSYLGIFISVVSAFSLMAVREYLQDRLNISEHELVLGSLEPKKDAHLI